MRIVQLTAENVKRLVAVDITPAGDVVVVSGRNGQGKTSVLDAIWFALGGREAQRDTPVPVRRGSAEASVRLDLGDLVVTRTWKADGKETLRVESPDGARYGSPQSVLDALAGRLTFDPLEFARQRPREQRETLLDLVQLPYDPSELAARRQTLFTERTAVNRTVRDLEGELRSTEVIDAPDEEVPTQVVIESIRNAEKWVQRAGSLRRDLETINHRVIRLQDELEQATTQQTRLVTEIEQLPDPLPDPAVYERQLATLEQTNREVRRKQHRAAVATALEEQQARADRLTAQIDAVDDERESGLRAAAMPVDGLSVDDDGVTYRGVPFSQCSSAEQLRVSVAMAMALNPRLRVVRVTDGSLLDEESMATIAAMAAAQDYQIWVERVADAGEGVGFVIEDGTVVSP